jgi:hypothetical protein
MVLALSEEQADWLAEMQKQWAEVMRPFSLSEGWSEQIIKRGSAFVPIPILENKHVCNAKIVPSREMLLEMFPKGGVVGEVGTQHGYFARKIFDVVRPRELHLFDLSFEQFESAGLFTGSESVVKHEGDSSCSLARVADGYFDWLYIDADHTYQGVSRDIRQAVKKIKSSGFLAFNDFTYWSPLESCSYGVAHAVCELCLHQDWEVVFFALEPWMYCDIVVRPRSKSPG